jgi:hypothetical protein
LIDLAPVLLLQLLYHQPLRACQRLTMTDRHIYATVPSLTSLR